MSTVTHRQVLGFVWRYARQNALRMTIMSLLAVLATSVHLAQPWFYREAIDIITSRTIPSDVVYNKAMLMFVLGLAASVVGFTLHETASYVLGSIEIRMMQQIHSDVFAHVSRLSTKFHINTFAGATARRIGRGIDGVEQIMDRIWFDFIPASLFIVILTGILMSFSKLIGVVMLCGMLAYATLSISLNIVLAKLFRKADKQDTKVTANMVDSITGNALVKAFATHTYEQERHEEVVLEWKKWQFKSWKTATLFAWIQSIALLMIELALVLTALHLWRQGEFSAGSVVMLTFYMGHMWGYMRQIGNNVRNYLRGVSNCEEMVAMSLEPVEIADKDSAKDLKVPSGKIVFQHVTFQYESTVEPLFNDLNLAITKNEKIAFVGHSGAGKSTITKLLMRLYELTAGRIEIDGQDIANVTQESLRGSMSLVPQDPILFHRTIAENISYARPDATYKQIEKAAKLAHAHEFIAKLPVGYNTLVGERGVKLSGGERQRVAIARAILADKPILILDEATSSLDSISEQEIQEALEYLMQNRTAIIIAHRLSTVRSCDRIAVLDEGKLIACAPHTELLETCPVYKEMVDLQSNGMLCTPEST